MKQRNNKTNFRLLSKNIIAILFLIIIGSISFINIAIADKEYSEAENRSLQQKPNLTLAGIESGRFMTQYESYKSDQFIGRNFWVYLKTNLDLLSGKRESNGIFKGKDNYLLEDITKPDEKLLDENLEAIKNFQSNYSDIPMYMMLVPNAANIHSNKLPLFAVTADQNDYLKYIQDSLNGQINWIDVSSALEEHNTENIYYRTDHHWTTLGAYYAFQKLAKDFELDASIIENYNAYAVTDDFNGTLSSVSGYETGYKEPIYIYAPESNDNNTDVVVNYVDEQIKNATLYDTSKLDSKDKYSVFLGGNHSRIDIKTTSESTEKLLIIKDSYANCMIPFLVPYYRNIIIIDPRYFYGNIENIMQQNSISKVLFLYNCNTFLEDNSLNGVLNNPVL